MPSDVVVLRDDDQLYPLLIHRGWTVTARSWAAQLEVAPRHLREWAQAVAHLAPTDECRELREVDVPAALVLDEATAGDYPGSVATAHEALTALTASPSANRRGHGIFDFRGKLVAMTFVDITGDRAEVDFTVVARDRRGQGLATAVKAASMLALSRDGVTVIRTGGSEENRGILSTNEALGFQVDERWLTLTAPRR